MTFAWEAFTIFILYEVWKCFTWMLCIWQASNTHNHLTRQKISNMSDIFLTALWGKILTQFSLHTRGNSWANNLTRLRAQPLPQMQASLNINPDTIMNMGETHRSAGPLRSDIFLSFSSWAIPGNNCLAWSTKNGNRSSSCPKNWKQVGESSHHW